jgi:phage terminase small subunit
MLNQRQTVFVFEYLKSGNATAAYKKAYGVENDEVAKANASRLLTNANIKAKILKFKQSIEVKTGITIEAVVNRIAKLSDKAQKDSDKLRSLDMLMKHLGGYVTLEDIINKMTPKQVEALTEKIISHIKPDRDET